ncbi:hypothetical protein OPU71_16745 [Niveibacterium sp. 24ML]|uniref:hypothetical protein n=1 Tax=Niveibacterium sp. 24ML TaxID=2985512 RepID=UPI00226DB7BB|nr:hypothetical protein [Niveibacterium sp. 24ML]MCX9157774.1 hypothetical protein [Niveibacterium sp. 24ML]
MSPELDARLCARYPKIFADRHRSVQESCMGRGMDCDDGWFNLIDVLCGALQYESDHNQAPQVLAAQVKEKFGTLRFYVRGANDQQRGMIRMAEAMSARLCEVCGRPGGVFASETGYVSTRCAAHVEPDSVARSEFLRRMAAQIHASGDTP